MTIVYWLAASALHWLARRIADRCPGCGEAISKQPYAHRDRKGWVWCFECYFEFRRNG